MVEWPTWDRKVTGLVPRHLSHAVLEQIINNLVFAKLPVAPLGCVSCVIG